MVTITNPFQPIYAICDSGNSGWRRDHLPPFPRYIDVELTNRCNFHCLMCPTGVGTVKRASGFMSDGIFRRILKEIRPHKTPVRFIRWGEPLLHPKVLPYMRDVKACGSLIHLNTNGSLLTKSLMEEFLEIPLDSIKFSFQGVDRKSYREMRNRDFFDELLAKVEQLHAMRGDREKPFIHVSTTITYERLDQVRAFRDRVSAFVDLLTIGRTILEHIDIDAAPLGNEEKATLRFLKGQESVVKKHPECQEVFDKLSINWDGMVSACCGDYDNLMVVGDLSRQSLQEIWTSDRINRFRDLLVEMRHDELPLCVSCYDYFGIQTPGLQKTGLD